VNIWDQLELHEDRRTKPYVDTVGKITIGVGRNLTDKGLSDSEIDYLLMNDIRECTDDLKTFLWWDDLDDVRRNVLIDMRFNLGPSRFRQFKATLAAVAMGDYVTASDQMRKSKWYRQVKGRGERLARMMSTGLME
jgi:lysozyme